MHLTPRTCRRMRSSSLSHHANKPETANTPYIPDMPVCTLDVPNMYNGLGAGPRDATARRGTWMRVCRRMRPSSCSFRPWFWTLPPCICPRFSFGWGSCAWRFKSWCTLCGGAPSAQQGSFSQGGPSIRLPSSGKRTGGRPLTMGGVCGLVSLQERRRRGRAQEPQSFRGRSEIFRVVALQIELHGVTCVDTWLMRHGRPGKKNTRSVPQVKTQRAMIRWGGARMVRNSEISLGRSAREGRTEGAREGR